MALLFADSFDHYATADISKKWTQNNLLTISAGNGSRGTAAITIPSNSNTAFANVILPSTYATLIFSAKIKYTLGVDNAGMFLTFLDNGTHQCGLRMEADGKISFRRGATTIATTASGLSTSVEYHLEFKVTFHNSTGAYELRIDGVNVLSGSGVDTCNTANNQATGFGLGKGSNDDASQSTLDLVSLTGVMYFDDLCVMDTSGSIANDFLGAVRVDALLPSGAGNTTQLTASAGSNYQCVDDASYSETDYVSSSTATQKDTYAFGNLSHTPSSVFGVQVSAGAFRDDSGARQIAIVTRSGSTDYDGTSTALPLSGIFVKQVRETDPNTAAAWGAAGVNAAEFGVKVAA